MTLTRRQWLRLAAFNAAAAAFAGRFGALNALATAAADYKALVCVFLFGGNDANNLLVPNDGTGYADYARLRSSIALPQASLLPIVTATGRRPFGLHPNLPGLQALFNQNAAAVVANVGTLVQPTTRAQYLARTAPVPVNLFSHSDQQAEWQTGVPQSASATGWGGRASDAVSDMNGGSFPAVTSVAGTNIYCVGARSRPAIVNPGQAFAFAGQTGSASALALGSAMQNLLTFDSGVSLVQAANGITAAAYAESEALADALATISALQTPWPSPLTSVASQLQMVARIIASRATLGLNRQIFFVSMGGYDTHTGELASHQQLYAQLDAALAAFYGTTVELGVQSSVTTFTLSEFGRTMLPASGGGSDHAWGSHHLVVGGAVKGGDLYGTFPTIALGGPDDASQEGRWIPTTSLDQYAATLATWFGVPAASLQQVFPNLARFAAPTLGFV